MTAAACGDGNLGQIEKNESMLRLFSASALIIVLLGGAYSQQPENKLPTCDYTELYRKEGWVIPGIKGAKKKDGRTPVPDNPGVYVTELDPNTHAATIQTFRCSREHTGRLEVEDIDVGIGYLSAFDVDGQIFAYNLVYGIDGIGAEWPIKFYDLDGSGRFTVRRSERIRVVPDLIPDWVKHETDTKGK